MDVRRRGLVLRRIAIGVAGIGLLSATALAAWPDRGADDVALAAAGSEAVTSVTGAMTTAAPTSTTAATERTTTTTTPPTTAAPATTATVAATVAPAAIPAPAPTTTTPPPPPPPPPPTTAPPAGSGGHPACEADLVSRVDAARQANGRAALAVDTRARTVARNWTQHMADQHSMAHNPNYAQEMSAQGIQWSRVAENVAWNTEGSAAVHNSLMNSSGHRANILDSRFTHLGVGCVVDGNGTTWVTQNFYG